MSDRHRLLSLLLLMAISGLCIAKDPICEDANFAEHVQVNGTDLTLNGQGVRRATFLRINVYVAALYTRERTREARQVIVSETPQQLVLQFVRDVDVEDLRKGFLEGFEHAGIRPTPSLTARINKLNSMMSDIKRGQRMMFVRVPHSGVQVWVKGEQEGLIEGDDFAQAFLSIWFGADPPNAELKSGLLGSECR